MERSRPTIAGRRATRRTSRRRALTIGPLLWALAVTSVPAAELSGRLQLTDLYGVATGDSTDAALGHRTRNDVLGDGRLMWEPSWGRFNFAVHYEVSADHGGGVALAKARSAYVPEAPPPTLFDWTDTVLDRGRTVVAQKIDRLAIGYAAPRLVVRLGRQALTWGAGVVFHPMDLVDPFAPDTVDTEYKPGADMVYAQWLFPDGSDLQGVAVPRPIEIGGTARANASTFALHYRATIGPLGTTWLLARDHGDWTAAAGLSGSAHGAVWNAEVVPTVEPGRRVRTSALVNFSRAATILSRNATYFAEYYRNGFGQGEGGTPVDAFPADLAGRLARGQVFNTSRDYLAGGMRLEATPLLTLSPSLIANLDDPSFYAAAEVSWSLSDNANFIAGAQVPLGRKGTEYGGLPATGNAEPYVAPAATAYVQFRQHF
jgi:hypothetical protein